jgi:hypothetical protein
MQKAQQQSLDGSLLPPEIDLLIYHNVCTKTISQKRIKGDVNKNLQQKKDSPERV